MSLLCLVAQKILFFFSLVLMLIVMFMMWMLIVDVVVEFKGTLLAAHLTPTVSVQNEGFHVPYFV